jgi:hypothetical protein
MLANANILIIIYVNCSVFPRCIHELEASSVVQLKKFAPINDRDWIAN